MISLLFANPLLFFIQIAILLISVTLHELAHGYVALRLGDPTAKLHGRLTLNPLSHLDPLGTLMMMFLGFGYAKPVPVDPYNFANPRKDMMKVALAGPLTNFLQAIVFTLLFHLLSSLTVGSTLFLVILKFAISINLVLGLFNLLPFAPLDGYKIVTGILPEDKVDEWLDLERYGFIMLIAFIIPFVGNRSAWDMIITPIVSFLLYFLVG